MNYGDKSESKGGSSPVLGLDRSLSISEDEKAEKIIEKICSGVGFSVRAESKRRLLALARKAKGQEKGPFDASEEIDGSEGDSSDSDSDYPIEELGLCDEDGDESDGAMEEFFGNQEAFLPSLPTGGMSPRLAKFFGEEPKQPSRKRSKFADRRSGRSREINNCGPPALRRESSESYFSGRIKKSNCASPESGDDGKGRDGWFSCSNFFRGLTEGGDAEGEGTEGSVESYRDYKDGIPDGDSLSDASTTIMATSACVGVLQSGTGQEVSNVGSVETVVDLTGE